MAMTSAQRATVRRRTSASATELSDVELDAIYDDTSLGNSSVDYTTYYVLREMLGVAATAVDKSNEVDEMSIKSSQRFDHLAKLLEYWGGTLGLGLLMDAAIAAGGIAAPCGEYIDCYPHPCLNGDCP